MWWSAQIAAEVPPDLAAVTPATVAACFSTEPTAAGIVAATSRIDSATVNEVLAPVHRQHDGRVVLIGDAAHPVGAGQGASMALEDAVVLARELGATGHSPGGVDVEAALASFIGLRAARLGKMTKSASRNRDAKTAGPVAARIRDLVMPVMFNRMYERATGWLYDFDPGSLPSPDRVVDDRSIAAADALSRGFPEPLLPAELAPTHGQQQHAEVGAGRAEHAEAFQDRHLPAVDDPRTADLPPGEPDGVRNCGAVLDQSDEFGVDRVDLDPQLVDPCLILGDRDLFGLLLVGCARGVDGLLRKGRSGP